MSFHSKASAFSEGSGGKTEEPASLARPRAPWAHALGTHLGLGQAQHPAESGEEGGPSRPQSPKWQWDLDCMSESQLEASQGEAQGLEGCQARPNTPTCDGWGAVDPLAQFAAACAAILQPLSDPSVRVVRGFQSTESSVAGAASVCAQVKTGSSGKGVVSPPFEQTRQARAAWKLVSTPRRHRLQGLSKKRGARRRLFSDTDDDRRTCEETVPRLSSDSTSSQELMDMHPERDSIREQEDQAIDSSSEELPERHRRWTCTSPCRDTLPPTSGPLLTSTLQGLTRARNRPEVAEQGPSSSKKIKRVTFKEERGSDTLPEVAAAGDLPQATCKRKVAKRNACLEHFPKVVLGSAFAPWGSEPSEASVYPASFPKISGISLLEKPSSSSSLPWAPKQSMLSGLGKQSPARRKSQPAAARDGGPNGDPDPRAQRVGLSSTLPISLCSLSCSAFIPSSFPLLHPLPLQLILLQAALDIRHSVHYYPRIPFGPRVIRVLYWGP